MKRLIFILMCFISMLGAPAEQFIIGDLKYTVIANHEVSVSAKDESISGEVTIPQFIYAQDTKYSVTTIGSQGFYDCRSLTSIEIPNSVTSIGKIAFSQCTNLTSVNIPNSVTSIGDGAFLWCTSLTSINVDTANNYYCSIDGFLFNKNATTLIQYPIGKSAQSYNIPNSVTTIGKYAFSSCTNLTSVNIPNTVTSIEYRAFYDCTSLTSIDIPNSVTSIGDGAFLWCTSLTSIDIPNSVTSIGENAFSNCRSLTSIDIPNSVTSIGDRAFYDCTSLTSIDIPNSVTSIGDEAFYDCTNLTTIHIPNSVTSIGAWAFYHCTSLTSIDIPNSVTSIGKLAFYYCTSLTSIDIPNSVTSIGELAFYNCRSFTSINVETDNNYYCSIDGVLFNKNATTIIQYPIRKSDQSYNIPNSVTAIGKSAFSYCTSLTSINISNAVTSIGDEAFYNCKSLNSVYCQPTTPPTGAPHFYVDVYANATLYVPSESKDLYASTEPWSKFQNIVGYDFSGVEEVLNYDTINVSVEHDRLTVTGLPDGERIRIYSMAGRVIYSGSAGSLPSLAPGFYIISAPSCSPQRVLVR